MAKVHNAVEILPKIWTAWVGHTNVTDDRQTIDGRATANSERKHKFTFAKKYNVDSVGLYNNNIYLQEF